MEDDIVTFELRAEHITLDALLKATGTCLSGGAAKQLIQTGQVQVNAEPETRRGRKLRAGEVVLVGSGPRIVLAPPPPEAA